jgi:tyrosyl-tRNA synthetase
MTFHTRLATTLAPLLRTVESITPQEDFLRKWDAWKAGKRPPLRCKYGIDPTSTSVHVGNGIPLWNLRRLQDLGCQAVLILGDYTALVGDPSGKDRTRPMLSSAQVEQNVATWLDQIGKILDMPRVEVHRNGEWFSTMPFLEVLRLADRMTVQQMLERESFDKRWRENAPISIREFLYCLMQGWDSVQVAADVELGGTDQTFNLNVGRRLMEQEGMEPQVTLINPLVEGTDGAAKMSKSLGNSIGLSDEPKEMFGKAMRISDALLPKYLRLLTDLPDERIDALLAPGTNPRDAKLAMAEALVRRYHGETTGTASRDEFVRVISMGEMPSEMAEVDVAAGEQPMWALVAAGKLASSTSEARRKIQEGAVRVYPAGTPSPEPVVATMETRWTPTTGDVLKLGRRWARLRVRPA